jgi:hypothetical protein
LQGGELALEATHALLLHLHILGELALTHLDLFDASLETFEGGLMFLHLLGVARLLGALVHRQGSIPLDTQILQFFGQGFTLEAFLLENRLQLPKGIEEAFVAANHLVTMQIKGIRDALSRTGEHSIGSSDQPKLFAQPVERD